MTDRTNTTGLTRREREVVALYESGLRVPEIARRLSLAKATPAGYIKSARRKLGPGEAGILKASNIRARSG